MCAHDYQKDNHNHIIWALAELAATRKKVKIRKQWINLRYTQQQVWDDPGTVVCVSPFVLVKTTWSTICSTPKALSRKITKLNKRVENAWEKRFTWIGARVMKSCIRWEKSRKILTLLSESNKVGFGLEKKAVRKHLKEERNSCHAPRLY